MNRIKILFALLILAGSSFAQSFYQEDSVQTIRITFNQTNWDALMDAQKAGAGDYIMAASVSINGVVYDSVGVKYKGNSTYRDNQIKNPLHIELDTYKDQEHEGYTDIKLANIYNDPSFVREALSYKILRNYMDAPLSNFANVYINNSLIGIYTSSESVSKKFVKSRFGSNDNVFVKCNPPAGAGPTTNDYPNLVYLGTDSTQYYAKYELKSDGGWNELIHLCDTLANHTSDIENILDVDRALWMLAFNNVLVNLDSYSGQFTQNYYLYKGDDGRFLPIVWDLNESFGSFTQTGSGSINGTAGAQQMTYLLHQNDASFPLISKLLAIPTYKRMYLAHIKTMLQDNFTNNGPYYTMGQQMQATINSSVQADVNKFYTYANFTSNLTNDVSTGGGGPGGGGPGGRSKPGITNLMNGRYSYLMSQSDFTASEPAISSISLSNNSPFVDDTIVVNATVTNEVTVYLRYRSDSKGQFSKVQMFDDGLHNDGAANDNVYGADLAINSGSLEYYIYAENNTIGKFSPTNAEHEFYKITAQSKSAGNLVINEFMASNNATVADQDGEFDDWIEIYNKGSVAIDISDYRITDDASDFDLFAFPAGTMINPDSYVTIWADGDTSQTGFHADFKLSSGGESVYLADGTLIIVDSVNFGTQVTDSSYGRFPNGTGNFKILPATFGRENVDTMGAIINSIVINEFMASNGSTVADQDGEYDDWIEIYNRGTVAVDISNYKLSDDLSDFSLFSFPTGTILNANEYITVWADGDTNQLGFHANFKLSAGGESLYLTDTLSVVIDSVNFGTQVTDSSYGRFPNGTGSFQLMPPTFGLQNSLTAYLYKDIVINEFLAVNTAVNTDQDGEFDDWIEIYNKGSIAVDLQGLSLSDDKSNLTLFTFSNSIVLQPDSYLVVWADQDLSQSGYHANFGLAATGETIYLSDASANMVDSIAYPNQTADVSYGRYPNGTGDFQFMVPTFASINALTSVSIGDLVINEFLASNTATIADQDGEYDDWIELFNKGVSPINLNDYFLSDDASNLQAFNFPIGTTLAPDSFIVVWADNDTTQAGYHANFKLSASGETLYLSNNSGIVDSIAFATQKTDVSLGRFPNGTGSFLPMTPTFGAINIYETGIEDFNITLDNISIYPNPVEGVLTIEVEENTNSLNLSVFNSNGQLVYENLINGSIQIGTDSWAKGLYFLRIQNLSSKIIVK